MTQRTIAAITQPSHTWKASRRIASQIPKPIAPTRPTDVAAVPTIATRLRLSVAPGVSSRAERDHDDPGHHERADQRRRAQQVQREDPVLEAHAEPDPVRRRRCRPCTGESGFDAVGRHRQAAEADADGVEHALAIAGAIGLHDGSPEPVARRFGRSIGITSTVGASVKRMIG